MTMSSKRGALSLEGRRPIRLKWEMSDLVSWGETYTALSGLYRKRWTYIDPTEMNPDGILFYLSCPDGTELGPFGCESAVDLAVKRREEQLPKIQSVWDAIEEDPEQAAVMKIRSGLMRNIKEHVAAAGWGSAEAAARCGLTDERLCGLEAGKVDAFTIEELVRVAARVGLRVRIEGA